MEIRPTRETDVQAIVDLYRRVAKTPGGLARLEEEIDLNYVEGFVSRTLESGLGYVADSEGTLVGEIHAYTPPLYCFSHVLSELTIAVDPRVQSRGVGRRLFAAFMEDVADGMPEIHRVELISRESNARAISFYESLGFVREGTMTGRIRNPDGTLESDVPMAWIRP